MDITTESLETLADHYRELINSIVENTNKYKNADILTETKKELLTDYTLCPSLGDRLGNVLTKRDKIYRGINLYRIDIFQSLWNTGILQSLAEFKLIVGVTITQYYTRQFPLIIEVDKLLVIPPMFLTFSTTRQIAVKCLIIEAALSKFGFHLADTHEQNWGFNKGEPVLMDIGSILITQNTIPGQFENDLRSNVLNKLLMLSTKKSFYARSKNMYLYDNICSFAESLEWQAIYNYTFNYHRKNSSKEYNKILKQVFEKNCIKPAYVDFLFQIDKNIKSNWENYSDYYFSQNKPTDRFLRILELVNDLTPTGSNSFADLAGNSGYFCSLIAQTKRFDRIINLDNDEMALEKGKQLVKNKGIDFFKIGFADLLNSGISADVTVALAVTHHLILGSNFGVFDVLRTIALVTKKIAFVEFSPLGYFSIDGALPSVQPPTWYTEAHFENCFNASFKLIHKEVVSYASIDGKDVPHRILYVGIPDLTKDSLEVME